MKASTIIKQAVLKQWQSMGIEVNPAIHSITREDQQITVEPKVMDLLMLLLEQPNQVLSKTIIMERLWSGRWVNEEALTKLVSKLRQALGDDPRQARFIKTVTKKGYLLLAEEDELKPPGNPVWLWSAAAVVLLLASTVVWLFSQESYGPEAQAVNELDALLHKADSHYYQYQRLDNESAIKLYEQIMARDGNHAMSQAGLANALVQRTLRWPDPDAAEPVNHINLATTVASGRLDDANIQAQLSRAEGLAGRAVRLAPDNGKVHRSLGLVYAVQQRFDLAAEQYRTAIELDPDEWGAMINLSEIHSIKGQPERALAWLIEAHQAMTRNYRHNEVIIRPWYTELATTIADRSVELDNLPDAEIWYRKALETEPYHEAALRGLMAVLKHQGNTTDAAQLCFELQQKIDPQTNCVSNNEID